jgi:nucleotide-binding universal stress UspA family protein
MHALRSGLFPAGGDFDRIYREIGGKIVESTARTLGTINAAVRSEVREGDAAIAIAEAAAERGADLVIVGSRGLRGVTSLVVGSVARAVVGISPKPVLVVKPSHKGGTERLSILFATDGTAPAEACADLLASLPFRDDTAVTVLNVVPSGFEDIPQEYAIEVEDRVKAAVAKARADEFDAAEKIIGRCRGALSRKYKRTDTMTRVGDPALEILNACSAIKADIVAVGCRGLRGVRGMLGSVSRHVLNHSECSVLIVKQ